MVEDRLARPARPTVLRVQKHVPLSCRAAARRPKQEVAISRGPCVASYDDLSFLPGKSDFDFDEPHPLLIRVSEKRPQRRADASRGDCAPWTAARHLILLVIAGHLSGTHGFGRLDLGIGDYAHLGVVVFFVISGLPDYEPVAGGTREKRTRLTQAVLRASLAANLPASYAFLAILGLLWTWGIVELQARDLWHAVSYTVNYQPRVS